MVTRLIVLVVAVVVPPGPEVKVLDGRTACGRGGGAAHAGGADGVGVCLLQTRARGLRDEPQGLSSLVAHQAHLRQGQGYSNQLIKTI